MAAHNWRALRTRAAENGLGLLMAVPTMHIVLDLIEQVGIESSAQDAKTTIEARTKITGFLDKLYKPDPVTIAINGGEVGPPPGWSDEEVEASFDAFLSTAGG